MAKSGLAVGKNKGHITTSRKPRARPSRRKGKLNPRVKAIREIIREVSGYAPYERRMIELLSFGKDKRTLKFAKKRLGSHKRGMKKRELMQAVVQEMALEK